MRKRGIIIAALATVAAGILGAPAAHADGHGVGVYGVWANSVNVRDNAPGTTGCGVYPSVANCPSVQTKVNAGRPSRSSASSRVRPSAATRTGCW